MRRFVIALGFVFFFGAADVFAHCRTCDVDEYTWCLMCRDTDFNAAILCTLTNNGSTCRLEGGCTGPAGERCPFGCIEEDHAQLRPRELELKGEWQLVAVDVSKIAGPEKEKRHS